MSAPGSAALRRRLEVKIEELIALLDEIDGDENLEDSDPPEDGGDTEPNGDELDYMASEDDGIWYPHIDPKAQPMAQAAARKARAIRRRVRARAKAG